VLGVIPADVVVRKRVAVRTITPKS
jgi:hypothetical protein